MAQALEPRWRAVLIAGGRPQVHDPDSAGSEHPAQSQEEPEEGLILPV